MSSSQGAEVDLLASAGNLGAKRSLYTGSVRVPTIVSLASRRAAQRDPKRQRNSDGDPVHPGKPTTRAGIR